MAAEDWQYLYDERAAIAEYDWRMSRPDAETMALSCLKELGCKPFFLRLIKKTSAQTP